MTPQRERSTKTLVCTEKGERSPPSIQDCLWLQATSEEMRIRFWYSQGAFAMHKRRKMGAWYAPHLSFSLPNYLLPSLCWSSRLFRSSLWPQQTLFFPNSFSVPLSHFCLLLFLHFLTERILFSKIIGTHQYRGHWNYISFWGKAKKEKKKSLGVTSAKLRFKLTLSNGVATTRSLGLLSSFAMGWSGTRLAVLGGVLKAGAKCSSSSCWCCVW